MKLSNLRPAKGSNKSKKRVARGQGSGRGGTSTRGHKGAQSRSGHKVKRNFEGGQMPIQMRLPKRGFKNPNRVEYKVLNLHQLEKIAEKYGTTELTHEFLIANGIVGKGDRVKILGNGELTSNITVHAHASSTSAKEAVEAKGGSITIL